MAIFTSFLGATDNTISLIQSSKYNPLGVAVLVLVRVLLKHAHTWGIYVFFNAVNLTFDQIKPEHLRQATKKENL
ncbi:MAG: hypothetical protein P8144_01570 [Gammaproteobacteria bacterium]